MNVPISRATPAGSRAGAINRMPRAEVRDPSIPQEALMTGVPSILKPGVGANEERSDH